MTATCFHGAFWGPWDLAVWLHLCLALLTAGCAVSTFPTPSLQPSPSAVSTAPGLVLRYAVFPAPPYMIGAAEGETALSGIDVDIVQALAKAMGLPVEYLRCTWARCLELMQSGDADLLSSAYKKPDREVYLRYFDRPYLDQLPIAFYFLKGKPYTIETYPDLYSLPSVGVLHGASYFERFDQDIAVHKVEVPSQDQLFPMLLAGRVEAIAGYVPTENYRIAVGNYRGQIERSVYVYSETAYVYLALSRKSPLLGRLDEFNRMNQALLDTGVISRTVTAYYDQYR